MSFSHTDIYHDREKKNCAQVKTSSADTLVIKRELGSPFDKWVETVRTLCNLSVMVQKCNP